MGKHVIHKRLNKIDQALCEYLTRQKYVAIWVWSDRWVNITCKRCLKLREKKDE